MYENSILFVSNCFGEDRTAALIAKEFNKLLDNKKNIEIFGATLIGDGKEYLSRNINLIHYTKLPPSGGFPTKSITGLFKDLFSGSVFNIFNFLNNLKKIINNVSLCVVVGDVFLLWLVRRIYKKKIIFLFLPKSYYIEPYYKIEINYILKNVDLLLTRDKYTADQLNLSGIPALFLGNPIMDDLSPTGIDLKINKNLPVIGILPGSRDEAYKNLILILNLIEIISNSLNCQYIIAFSSNIDIKKVNENIKKFGWNIIDNNIVKNNKIFINFFYNAFNDIIHNSDIIIGLAGTANEQAAGIGKPVITFKGFGPQTTKSRFLEQEKLLGGASKFISNYPQGVINEIIYLINNPQVRKERGEIGKIHMGPSGGAFNIAKYIYEKYL